MAISFVYIHLLEVKFVERRSLAHLRKTFYDAQQGGIKFCMSQFMIYVMGYTIHVIMYLIIISSQLLCAGVKICHILKFVLQNYKVTSDMSTPQKF